MPIAVLRAFWERLSGLLQQAEQFRRAGPGRDVLGCGYSRCPSLRYLKASAALLASSLALLSLGPVWILQHCLLCCGPHLGSVPPHRLVPRHLQRQPQAPFSCSSVVLVLPPPRRGVLGDVWLPRVGAAICAAHHLEHQLREPQGMLLLAELQDSAAGGEGGAAAEPAAAPAQPAASPAKAGRSQVALLEREAAAFASLRRQWAFKLAKLAVDRFHQLFAPYK